MRDLLKIMVAMMVAYVALGVQSNKTDALWPLPASYSFETEG